MCGARTTPSYGLSGGTSLPSEGSARLRRDPHLGRRREDARVGSYVTATLWTAAEGMARATAKKPARPRARCRSLAATLELRGKRTVDAEPRHGRLAGRDARSAAARAGRSAPGGRICADVSGASARLCLLGAGPTRVGAAARAPGAVSCGRARSKVERATDKRRRAAVVRAIHGSLGSPSADESAPVRVRPTWTQTVDRELGNSRARSRSARVPRSRFRNPRPRRAGDSSGAGSFARDLDRVARRRRGGSTLSSRTLPEGCAAAQLLLDDHHRRCSRRRHGARAADRVLFPRG